MKILLDMDETERTVTYEEVFGNMGNLLKEVDTLCACLEFSGYLSTDRWDCFQNFHLLLKELVEEVGE